MVNLGKKEIHLWMVDDGEITEADLLAAYRDLLDKEEQGRYRRLVFEKDRHRFLVTRALVRSVLGRYEVTDPPADLSFNTGDHGKPEIAWSGRSGGIHFNVSHTRGLIVLGVVHGHEVGVDVEYLERKAEIGKLAERYFSPLECEELEDMGPARQHDRFFDLWTLKESYIKASGLGLSVPLEDFSFRFEGRRIRIAFSPQRNDAPERWRFWQLRPDSDHKLAVALTGKDLDGYRLLCRRGIPMREFEEVPCRVFRSSEAEVPSAGDAQDPDAFK